MDQNPFVAATGGEPRLLDSYLVFVDALGSKVLQSSDAAQLQERFSRFRAAWLGAKRSLEVGAAVASFSDNVVAAMPVTDEDDEAHLSTVIDAASWFQALLACEGIPVRGAIERGLLWADDELVYGTALVEAYELERAQAYYPRIILSERVAADLSRFRSYYTMPGLDLTENVLVGADQLPFVNYLRNVIETIESDSARREFLDTHRNAAVSLLFDARNHPREFDKARWVASYHNYFVVNRFPGQSELLVEPADDRYAFFSLADVIEGKTGDDTQKPS